MSHLRAAAVSRFLVDSAKAIRERIIARCRIRYKTSPVHVEILELALFVNYAVIVINFYIAFAR